MSYEDLASGDLFAHRGSTPPQAGNFKVGARAWWKDSKKLAGVIYKLLPYGHPQMIGPKGVRGAYVEKRGSMTPIALMLLDPHPPGIHHPGAKANPRRQKNPVPFIEKRGGGGNPEWAYLALNLIRASYTSPSRDHRPAPLPRGRPPAVMFTMDFFVRMAGKKEGAAKRETLKRHFERWKSHARNYGLERPDAYSQAMPRGGTNAFFALDVLGTFDAVWAILGPPHPLEAARVGGFQMGEAREFDLIEAGQERFEGLEEPLPFEKLAPEAWSKELRTHSRFWSGDSATPRVTKSQQSARHYSIYPGIQDRLRAAESYVDLDEMVSTLPPILTEEERKQAHREAAQLAGGLDEKDAKGRRRPKRKRFASDDVILKLEELESHLGLNLLLKALRVNKGTLTRIRNKTKELSVPREQLIHVLYGKAFGGPVPRLKGPRRKAAPEAKKALRKLVKELGEKKTARRLMEVSGARKPFTNHRVNLKVLQIRRWLGAWKDWDGKKRKPTEVWGRSAFNITRLYDQVISQVQVPEAPEDWRAVLFFVLDRMSQNKLSKRIGMSRGSILNWVKGAHAPSVPMQAKLAEVAEEVKGLARDPAKGARPGKTIAAPFTPPVNTPPDVSRAVHILHDTLGAKSAAEAVGVSKDHWKTWATGRLHHGKRSWVPSSHWGKIVALAHQADPSFQPPSPGELRSRADVHAGIVYLFERAGRQRASEILGMHPDEIAGVMSSPYMPPPDVARHILEAASRKYSASELGRESRLGTKRTIRDVVPGWREMLRELAGRHRTMHALSTALRAYGYKTGGPVLKRALGDGMLSHKGQRAIASLHKALGQYA